MPDNEMIAAAMRSVEGVEGWCSPEKAGAMASLVLEFMPVVVVEIGVFGGRSMIPQAIALRHVGHGHIYGIDPWEKGAATEGQNDPAHEKWWRELDLEKIHQGCMAQIARHKLQEQAIVIRTASQYCDQLFPTIDILHIDGQHSELSSCRDVKLYLPKLIPGGYVWMDDCDWETTQAAIKMVQIYCEEIKQVNNCKLFQKR